MRLEKPSLVIWGAAGHAMVVADIVRLQRCYELVGFIDDVNLSRKGDAFCQSIVLGGCECLPQLRRQGVSHALIAVGDPVARLKLADRCLTNGFQLATASHPAAILASDVSLGPGTVVAAGAVIAPGATLGRCSLVNHLASVDHGCKVDDGSTICPGARIAGDVTVGRATWIGIGASVRERLSIGEYSIVGAGAVVVKNIPRGCLAYGVPARVVRRLEHHVHQC